MIHLLNDAPDKKCKLRRECLDPWFRRSMIWHILSTLAGLVVGLCAGLTVNQILHAVKYSTGLVGLGVGLFLGFAMAGVVDHIEILLRKTEKPK